MMYKILLTGVTGFIGSHVMRYLGSVGYDIDYISHQEFMYEDFSKLDSFKPDVVVHIAWAKLPLQSTDHLEFAEMTCNFYSECKKRGMRVINIGSSSEYGVKSEPMREDMVCEPVNTYGIAKLMVTLFAKKLGFNTLRLFTVVGKGGHSFFDNKYKYKGWEHPYSVRTLVTIDVVCKAIERLIHAEHLYGEIINVGSDAETRYIEDEAMGDSRWMKAPQNQYEPRHWESCTKKMHELLNI